MLKVASSTPRYEEVRSRASLYNVNHSRMISFDYSVILCMHLLHFHMHSAGGVRYDCERSI